MMRFLRRLAACSRLPSLALAAAFAVAGLGVFGSGAHAEMRLPALGEADAEGLSIGTERQLGRQIMRDIRRDPEVVDDPLVRDYLDSIFQPLVAAARRRGDISPEVDAAFAWEPFLVRDRSFNAFALPGGYIGVHLGLIAASGSSDEMASVLGHELSHITQRHIARSMAASKRQSMAATAAMLIGLLASTRSRNGDLPTAIVASGQAAMAAGQLTFSREMEREADRFGLDVMTAAGFAPSGMASMFERLDLVSRLNDSNQYPYLRSHPLTIERLSEARLRARETGAVDARLSRPAEHALMRARAKVLMDGADQALRRMQAQGLSPAIEQQNGADRLGALYGAALASMFLHDFKTADATAQAAAAWVAEPDGATAKMRDRSSAAVKRDLALLRLEIATARRAAPTIASAAADAALQGDSSRPTLLTQAEGAIARQAARDPGAPAVLRTLTERLQAWVSEHPRDALAWSLLSRCAEPIGLKLRALRADAESHAAQADLQGAIDRLHAGQRQARTSAGAVDFVEASIIDSRLHELEAEQRDIEKETKIE